MSRCDHCGYQSVMAHYDDVKCFTCGFRPKTVEPLPLVDNHHFTLVMRPLSKTAQYESDKRQRGEQRRVELEARRKRVLELAPNYTRQEIASALVKEGFRCTPRQVELDLRGAK